MLSIAFCWWCMQHFPWRPIYVIISTYKFLPILSHLELWGVASTLAVQWATNTNTNVWICITIIEHAEST